MFAFLLSWLGVSLVTIGCIAGIVAALWLLPRPYSHYVALALVCVALAQGYSAYIYQSGIAACEASVAEAVRVERDRQAKANAEANEFQRGLVAGLQQSQRDLTATLKDNDDEAVSDPDAASCGLSVGGVRRYERLRGGTR